MTAAVGDGNPSPGSRDFLQASKVVTPPMHPFLGTRGPDCERAETLLRGRKNLLLEPPRPVGSPFLPVDSIGGQRP